MNNAMRTDRTHTSWQLIRESQLQGMRGSAAMPGQLAHQSHKSRDRRLESRFLAAGGETDRWSRNHVAHIQENSLTATTFGSNRCS